MSQAPADSSNATDLEQAAPQERSKAARFFQPEGYREAAESFVAGMIHPIAGWISLAAIFLGLFILSPVGSGISMCGMKQTTGLPCPGCGLTRSVTSMLHGDLIAAWQYNPFGFGFALFFLLAAPTAFLTRNARARLRDRIRPYSTIIFSMIMIFVISMLGHGILRATLVASNVETYTWWADPHEVAPALSHHDHDHGTEPHSHMSQEPAAPPAGPAEPHTESSTETGHQ